MDDLILITNIIKYFLSYPFSVFGFTITLGSVILGTFLLSVSISFVLKFFGGD